MTTGSYDRSSFTTIAGGRVGLELTKTWSGTDSTPAQRTPRVQRVPYRIARVVRDGKGRTKIKYITLRTLGSGNGRNTTPRKRLPDNPYSMTWKYRRDSAAQYDPRISSTPRAYLASCMPAATTQEKNLFGPNDDIKLVNKLKERMQGSDFNPSVFLGEAHQSLRMIADAAIRIAKSGYHLRKGDLSGAARSLLEGTSRQPLKPRHKWDPRHPERGSYPNLRGDTKNLANNWLELQYGWLPLLSDAEGAAELLAHHLEVPLRTTYRVVQRRQETKTFLNNDGVPNGIGVTGSRGRNVVTHSRMLIARVEEDLHPTLAAKLGLLDPELVAWELLPFSFVADWFIPIGDFMEARAFSNRLKGTFITSSLWKKDELGSSISPGTQWVRSTINSGVFSHEVSFTRTVSTSLKVALPEFKPFRKVATWKHCANALALVSQVFTRRETKFTPEQQRLFKTPAVLPESYWHF